MPRWAVERCVIGDGRGLRKGVMVSTVWRGNDQISMYPLLFLAGAGYPRRRLGCAFRSRLGYAFELRRNLLRGKVKNLLSTAF